MKKFILTALVLACTSVYADTVNSGSNNGNKTITYNTVNEANATPISSSITSGNNLASTAQGGAGGTSFATGGMGGNSTATGGTSNSASIAAGGNSSATGGNATGGTSTSTAVGGLATGGTSAAISTGSTATTGASTSSTGASSSVSKAGDSYANTGSSTSTGGTNSASSGASTSKVDSFISVGCTSNCGANGTDKEISESTNTTNKDIAAGHDQAARDVANSKIRNTPSMFGPALVSSNDTCMGSTSGSLAAPGFGISIGSTWVDENCKMLKNSQALWNMGFKAASVALLCNDVAIKSALELTGYVCPTKPAQ